MTRLAYRAALALLLAALAIGEADLVAHGHGMPSLLGAVALAYLGLIVLAYALGAAWHVGRAEACGLVHRGRRVVPKKVLAAQRTRADVEEAAHAEAMAAVAAEPMAAAPPPTIGFTGAGAAISGVVWEFTPRGVAKPPPQPWGPPVTIAVGRHAGTAASDLSEWGAFEYARPQ